jgi:predicted nucleotidyltransferase
MLQKSNTERVLQLFFTKPTTQHYLLGISRELSLAHTSVKNILAKLEKEKIITKRIVMRNSRAFPHYQANLNNNIYTTTKKIYNLKTIYEHNVIETLQKELFYEALVLFGSYAKGEDTEHSDIDIYVQAKEKTIDTQLLEKKLQRKVQLHFAKHINKLPPQLQQNIINGIVLDGFLTVTLDKSA